MPSLRDIIGLVNLAILAAGNKSQRQLALEMHINHGALTTWKNGKALPRDENLVQLCEIAGEDPTEWLMRLNMARTDGVVKQLYEQMLDQYLASRPDNWSEEKAA